MIKKLSTFFIFFVLAIGSLVCEEDMLVYASDIRLEYVGGNTFDTVSGYHLYIRKKDGVESVMLTETTKDPAGKEDNYAFRALEYNTYNGDEIRYLDGKPLVSEGAKYSLIDSTPEDDAEFGSCFHIFIPAEMQYGYPWTRNGTIKIKRGTFINIRTFEKKYGDYEGSFADNPFMFDLGMPEEEPLPVPEPSPEPEPVPVEEVKEPVPILTDDYNSDAASKFKEIASTASGKIIYSRPVSLIDDIINSIDSINPKEDVDVVFAIDTTGSMKDDVALLKEELIPRLLKELHKFGKLRLGLLLYRDYGDSYNYKGIPIKMYQFTTDTDEFVTNLNKIYIRGTEGGDTQEAVYEALYGAISFYSWNKKASKKVILIGDAPPHDKPRGLSIYSSKGVENIAKKKDVSIDAIVLPDNKGDRGRWDDMPF